MRPCVIFFNVPFYCKTFFIHKKVLTGNLLTETLAGKSHGPTTRQQCSQSKLYPQMSHINTEILAPACSKRYPSPRFHQLISYTDNFVNFLKKKTFLRQSSTRSYSHKVHIYLEYPCLSQFGRQEKNLALCLLCAIAYENISRNQTKVDITRCLSL